MCAQNWHTAPAPAQRVLCSFPVGKGWGEMTCCTGDVPGKDARLGTLSLLVPDSHCRELSLPLLVLSISSFSFFFSPFFSPKRSFHHYSLCMALAMDAANKSFVSTRCPTLCEGALVLSKLVL